jgi:hypothetical protein
MLAVRVSGGLGVTSVVGSTAGCSEPQVADRHADLTPPLCVHLAL